ncbi:CFS1-like protein [Mycena leptocephala]|nr:CFS1-like protein [Mycena leptocephala]
MTKYSIQQASNAGEEAAQSILGVSDALWWTFAKIGSASFSMLYPIARRTVLNILSKIISGQITVHVSATSEIFVFGHTDPPLQATIYVRDNAFWTRVAFFTDLGFAEAFMSGDVDCDDISSLIQVRVLQHTLPPNEIMVQILIANRRQLIVGSNSILLSVIDKGRTLANHRFVGSLANSRHNISAHYDLGNIMFQAFLSEDMNYSSAIFRDFTEDLHSQNETTECLEDAQMRKIRFILNKANIHAGDRILEIGTGWGSLAMAAVTTFDCTVDTITLSSNQCDLAKKRIVDAGLSDRITVHCMDFRECKLNPQWAGAFDKFISIEMIEHVGKDFLVEYWSVADWALNSGTGVGVIQSITIPEARVTSYEASVDFAQKWEVLIFDSQIFPGGYLPNFSQLVRTLNEGSMGRLIIDSVTNIGPHYARTLREWKRRFLANWENVISKALVAHYALNTHDLEFFKRKWIYYFDYCEAAFRTRTLGDHILTFTREGDIGFAAEVS